jgi:5'-deoxynucleotidase YfbR-like HD superfamily hydrolase
MSYYITNSGIPIDIKCISEFDINLRDIAHHLTRICRYGGALDLDYYYSVAQHSIQLVRYAKENNMSLDVQRALLMHDAAEAYLGDVVRGLKHMLPDYALIENKVSELIFNKYNIVFTQEIKDIVKELDSRIILDEAKRFFPLHFQKFAKQYVGLKPLNVEVYSENCLTYTFDLFLEVADFLDIKEERKQLCQSTL